LTYLIWYSTENIRATGDEGIR